MSRSVGRSADGDQAQPIDDARRFGLRGAARLLTGQWGKYFIQIVSVFVLSRLLTPGSFGTMAIVVSIMNMASVFADLGLSTAALSRRDLSLQQRSGLFWANLAIGLVLAVGLVTLSWAFGAIFHDRLVPLLLAICSSVFVMNGAVVQFRVNATRLGVFGLVSVIDVMSALVGLIAAIIGALLGAGVFSLALQQVLTSGTSLVLFVCFSSWHPGRPRLRTEIGSIVNFGIAVFFTQILNSISSSLDSLLLGRYCSPERVGAYNRALQISLIPVQQLASPLTRFVLPRSAKLQQNASQSVLTATVAAVESIHRPLTWIAAIGLSLLACESPFLVRVALGTSWDETARLVPLLALAALLQISGYFLYWVLVGVNRGVVLLFSEVIPRIAIIVALILLAPRGPIAVAWVLVGGQVLMLGSGIVYAMPRIGIPFRDALSSCLGASWLWLVLMPASIFGIDILMSYGLTPGTILARFVVWSVLVVVCTFGSRQNRSTAAQFYRLATQGLRGLNHLHD